MLCHAAHIAVHRGVHALTGTLWERRACHAGRHAIIPAMRAQCPRSFSLSMISVAFCICCCSSGVGWWGGRSYVLHINSELRRPAEAAVLAAVANP